MLMTSYFPSETRGGSSNRHQDKSPRHYDERKSPPLLKRKFAAGAADEADDASTSLLKEFAGGENLSRTKIRISEDGASPFRSTESLESHELSREKRQRLPDTPASRASGFGQDSACRDPPVAYHRPRYPTVDAYPPPPREILPYENLSSPGVSAGPYHHQAAGASNRRGDDSSSSPEPVYSASSQHPARQQYLEDGCYRNHHQYPYHAHEHHYPRGGGHPEEALPPSMQYPPAAGAWMHEGYPPPHGYPGGYGYHYGSKDYYYGHYPPPTTESGHHSSNDPHPHQHHYAPHPSGTQRVSYPPSESTFGPPSYPSSSSGTEQQSKQNDHRLPGSNYAVPLFMSCDEDSLSEYQCHIRKQIEVFAASYDEVSSTVQGRNRQIQPCQVGIRCRHCADLPIRQRERGAVYYPSKLSCIYQAAQNMASVHLTKHCTHVPESVRRDLLRHLSDRKSSAGSGKEYWAVGARSLGVVEEEGRLRFANLPMP